MGGALDYWSVVDMAVNSNVDQTLAGTLPMLFGNSADLEPDETGTCQKISITFEFTGRSAFFYEDVERELP